MTPDVVVDIGNTAIKLAAVKDGALGRGRGYVGVDATTDWTPMFEYLGFAADVRCKVALASVHPERTRWLLEWLERAGHECRVISDWKSLPIKVDVEFPDQVGIDRLLIALAARTQVPSGLPTVIVSAGTAVTVDLLDATGAFAGGAIFPGLHVMAQALHDYTAKLPLVDARLGSGYPPGRNTTSAIQLGVHNAVLGGVERLIRKYAVALRQRPVVLVTGGDAHSLMLGLETLDDFSITRVFGLTLEGIRIAAEALP